MLKVLQLSMGEVFGGIENIEIEWLNRINSNKIRLDVLTPNNNSFGKYKKNIKKGNTYDLNTTRKSFMGRIKYDIRLFKFLHKHKYDIVHINSGAFFYSFRLALISKLCKVKKVIAHSHTTYKYKGIKKVLFHLLNPIYFKLVNLYISVSNDAKRSLLSNKKRQDKVVILPNGVDINKYKYNERIRDKYIKKYNLDNKKVYGHVGRFSYEKNHLKLIDIFYEISKNEDSVLLLIGDGQLKNEIKEKVDNLGISDKVLFLGFMDNINEIINVIDIGIYPSLYEGFGIAILEMEINGIPLYCSNIPDEVNINNSIKIFNLDDKIIDIVNMIKNNDNKRKIIECNNYDINNLSKKLEKIYLDIIK